MRSIPSNAYGQHALLLLVDEDENRSESSCMFVKRISLHWRRHVANSRSVRAASFSSNVGLVRGGREEEETEVGEGDVEGDGVEASESEIDVVDGSAATLDATRRERTLLLILLLLVML